MLLFKIVFGL